MKPNALMVVRWRDLQRRASEAPLCKALADLAASPLVETAGAFVLVELQSSSQAGTSPKDTTGYEAATNKIHVSDYVGPTGGGSVLVQGVKYAESLVSRLRGLGRPFRIILSHDPDSGEVTVRFFVRRAQQTWGADDVNDYTAEEVIQWDVE